jgi:hypothetical protein
MEHPAGRVAEPMARFIERLSGRPTDHQTSRVLLETQTGRAVEQQAGRTMEQQASRAMEQQTSRAMEQQASRAMEQQASRAIEQQASRAMEQQASRAMEQQAETIPDWTSFLEGFTPAELGELLKINMATKVFYSQHLSDKVLEYIIIQ